MKSRLWEDSVRKSSAIITHTPGGTELSLIPRMWCAVALGLTTPHIFHGRRKVSHKGFASSHVQNMRNVPLWFLSQVANRHPGRWWTTSQFTKDLSLIRWKAWAPIDPYIVWISFQIMPPRESATFVSSVVYDAALSVKYSRPWRLNVVSIELGPHTSCVGIRQLQCCKSIQSWMWVNC